MKQAMRRRFVATVGSCIRHAGHCLSFRVRIVPRLGGAGDLSVRIRGRGRKRLVLGTLRPKSIIMLLSRNKGRVHSVRFTSCVGHGVGAIGGQLMFVVKNPCKFSPGICRTTRRGVSLSHVAFSRRVIHLVFIRRLCQTVAVLGKKPCRRR